MYESYLNLTIFTYILGKRFVDKDKQNLVNTLREKKRKERKNIDIIELCFHYAIATTPLPQ